MLYQIAQKYGCLRGLQTVLRACTIIGADNRIRELSDRKRAASHFYKKWGAVFL